MIDANEPRPIKVDEEVWNFLTTKRNSQKEKPEKMRAIAMGKASKTMQMNAIERAVIGQLVRITFLSKHSMIMSMCICFEGCLH